MRALLQAELSHKRRKGLQPWSELCVASIDAAGVQGVGEFKRGLEQIGFRLRRVSPRATLAFEATGPVAEQQRLKLTFTRKLGPPPKAVRIDSPIRAPPVVDTVKPTMPRAETKGPLPAEGSGVQVAGKRCGRPSASNLPAASVASPRVDWTRSAALRMDKSKLPRWGMRQVAALLAASRGDR